MNQDELEFSIAQYADGTLPAADRAALEERLARDPVARALLDEYRSLGDVLAGARSAALPEVRWDRLATEIAGAVAQGGERSDPTNSTDGLREPGGSAAGPKEDEFALARCADGTLDESERPAVEARLGDDPAALSVVMGYEAVDALLRRAPLPAVRWDALAAHVSSAVARHAAGGDRLAEEVEFAVAQYADGTLPADRRDVVEATLAAEPAARLALADYVALDAALKSAPAPDVRWDRLAEHLSAAVGREDEAARRGRDTRSYRVFAWAKRPAARWVAAAASVLLAVGIGIRLSSPPKPIEVVVDPPPPPKVLVVEGPKPEAPASQGEAVAAISIGPSLALQRMPGGAMQYADDVVARPPRIIIASGTPVEPDGAFQPY